MQAMPQTRSPRTNVATRVLRVVHKRAEAQDVVSLELVDAGGAPLPGYTPGAHLDLHLPDGLVRQYSLCGDAREAPASYRVAVGRAAASRGGSAFVHEQLRVGDTLQAGVPRNLFALDTAATSYCFIAGGIGITPILCMLKWCVREGRPWRLLYAAASRQRAAFVDELSALPGGYALLHFDNERRAQPPDLAALLHEAHCGEHLYCCGPAPMMDAVQRAAASWPQDALHFERFSAPPPDIAERRGFTVVLHQSGRTVPVAPQQSILQALEQHGILPAHSCREGVCGCCEVAVLDGVPEHHDAVLSEEEKARGRTMMICVSRARSASLTLDL